MLLIYYYFDLPPFSLPLHPVLQRAANLQVLSLRRPTSPLFSDDPPPPPGRAAGAGPDDGIRRDGGKLLEELCNALYLNGSITRLLLDGNAISVRRGRRRWSRGQGCCRQALWRRPLCS